MEKQQPAQFRQESRSRKFFRVVLGSMVGFFLASILTSIVSLFFMFVFIAALSLSGEPETKVEPNSILKLSLDKTIVERSQKDPFAGSSFASFGVQQMGLNDILNTIYAASHDSNIKGISINSSFVAASTATLEEIRTALFYFKAQGKFIYAYSNFYTQGAYYLASVADEIYINRMGSIDVKGVSANVMFYKGLTDKFDVDVQIIRHGTFKSAVEPFMLDKMSEANRAQMTALTTDMWSVLSEDIAKSRGITEEALALIADSLYGHTAALALEHQLVDKIAYYSDYETMLKNKIGEDLDDELNYVSVNEYKTTIKSYDDYEDKVAVIYAYGNIVDGKGPSNVIASENMVETIKEVREDDDIKAVVLRINSGGGSALASEIIWKEMELLKAAGKKVVVSMGDYAASGGYYIACNADCIFAQPSTLTGSIGVFGMIPSFQRFLTNKLGVTTDGVKTHAHSDMSSGRLLDEYEVNTIQMQIEEIYGLFIQRVADGRGMTVAEVDSIGQGRVWSGIRAKELGLVDELGSLTDAVAYAAQLAQITDYDIENYPEQKDWLTELLEQSMKVRAENKLAEELGPFYHTFKEMQTITEMEGVQARIPYLIEIK